MGSEEEVGEHCRREKEKREKGEGGRGGLFVRTTFASFPPPGCFTPSTSNLFIPEFKHTQYGIHLVKTCNRTIKVPPKKLNPDAKESCLSFAKITGLGETKL